MGRRSFGTCNEITPDVVKLDFNILLLNTACQSTLLMELSSLNVNILKCCEELSLKMYYEAPELIISTLQQSNEWHRQRKYRVTGKKTDIFMNISKICIIYSTGSRIYIFTYSKNDWNGKSLKYFYGKSFSNKFMKHGIVHESDAREAFSKQTCSVVIECGMVVSQTNPWLGFSPDGVIFENNAPVALIEIKCLFDGNNYLLIQ